MLSDREAKENEDRLGKAHSGWIKIKPKILIKESPTWT